MRSRVTDLPAPARRPAGRGVRAWFGPLLALALLAAPLAGCRSLSRPGQSQGPDQTPVQSVPALLSQADALYEAGDYPDAAQIYRTALSEQPAEETDRVLFRLAMIHLLPTSEVNDPETGRAYLDQLVSSFPDSPLAEPARLVLDLQDRLDTLDEQAEKQADRIDRLSRQLEALKRIDIERSKQPPPR